jgi:hypothetical protein
MMYNPEYYDLLVASSSWEARSNGVALRLSNDHRFKKAVVFRYRHSQESVGGRLENDNYSSLMHRLGEFCEDIVSVECNLWQPLDAVVLLNEAIRKFFGDAQNLRILFDVSTFTKAYTLVFLRYLDNDDSNNRLTLFYTDLLPPQRDRPTEGIRKIISLPFYGGSYCQGKEDLLLAFLGFEPERVIGLWESIEPQLTIPVYSLRRDGKNPLDSKALREQLLSRPGVSDPVQVPGSNPLFIAATLSKVYANYRGKYNIAVAAVGNKLQCIGLYIFTKVQRADVTILYPIAGRYKREYWNPSRMGPSVKIDISDYHVLPVENSGGLARV